MELILGSFVSIVGFILDPENVASGFHYVGARPENIVWDNLFVRTLLLAKYLGWKITYSEYDNLSISFSGRYRSLTEVEEEISERLSTFFWRCLSNLDDCRLWSDSF